MGRRAQPVDIIKSKGKSHHLTKEEIKKRKSSEVKFKNKKLDAPVYVKNDTVAFSKWKELVAIYKEIEFVSAPDAGSLARYCKHHSEYLNLIVDREKIQNIEIDFNEYQMSLPQFIQEGIDRVFKLDPLLKIENLINKKSQLLITLEDRLFLNPVSRIKNVPKKEAEVIDPVKARFGDI
jgi:phage terminase small subunit